MKEEERKAKERVFKMTKKLKNKRDKTIGNLFRSKGYIWIGNSNRISGFAEWNHAGNMLNFRLAGIWTEFPDTSAGINISEPKFIDKDPCQELVFIGQNLNKKLIEDELNKCLLNKKEILDLEKFMEKENSILEKFFEDPFMDWKLGLTQQTDLENQAKDFHNHNYKHN